jgi:molybdate transport system permease protein
VTDLSPFWLSLLVAGVGTLLMLPAGLAAAWWFSHSRPFFGKPLLETLLTLPLVLPPTVVGFYLLLIFGRGTTFGRWINDSVGIRLLFTWEGAAVAAAVMALPLFVRTAASAFASVEVSLLEAARVHGASEWTILFQVILPVSYRGLLAALALAFARALGEFGATLMVAGSIPGQTQTLPLALYAAVQAGEKQQAWVYTLLLTAVAFVILGSISAYQNRLATRRGERP